MFVTITRTKIQLKQIAEQKVLDCRVKLATHTFNIRLLWVIFAIAAYAGAQLPLHARCGMGDWQPEP